MSWVGAVIEHPVVTGVVSIFFSLCTGIDNTKLGGAGDKKHWGFICRAFSVGVNEVDESQDPSQVDDFIVTLEAAWRLF
jgi:hypothetical protein